MFGLIVFSFQEDFDNDMIDPVLPLPVLLFIKFKNFISSDRQIKSFGYNVIVVDFPIG